LENSRCATGGNKERVCLGPYTFEKGGREPRIDKNRRGERQLSRFPGGEGSNCLPPLEHRGKREYITSGSEKSRSPFSQREKKQRSIKKKKKKKTDLLILEERKEGKTERSSTTRRIDVPYFQGRRKNVLAPAGEKRGGKGGKNRG